MLQMVTAIWLVIYTNLLNYRIKNNCVCEYVLLAHNTFQDITACILSFILSNHLCDSEMGQMVKTHIR